MNKGVLICTLFISAVAVASAQSWLEQMMMFNLISGGGSGGSDPSGGYQATSTGYQTGQQSRMSGQRRPQNQGYRPAASRGGGMFGASSPLGGFGRYFALAQGGDRPGVSTAHNYTARGLIMCQMLTGFAKMMCLARGLN